MVGAVYTRVLVAVIATLTATLVAMVQTSDAHASSATDMSTQLDEYNAVCFDEAGEWLATDGCIKAAEALRIELENIIESDAKGCTLGDLFEDYSCKGPQGPSSSPSVSELGFNATAMCWDGSYSTSTGSGTCSHHGGIYTYL